MRKSGRWIAAAIAVAIVALIAWRIHAGGGATQKEQGRYDTSTPQAVGVSPVQVADVRVLDPALGTITPIASVVVRSQINGQLMNVNFREGQLVKKGDLLALVDPRPYQVALAQAQGQLTRDKALLEDARIDLARYEKLLSQDSIARQTVDTQRYQVQQDEGSVATDQAQIQAALLNLQYCHVSAPVSGRVGLRQVDPGNYVTVSDANGIVVLTQLEPISVIFTLPEDDLPSIMARVQAGAKLPVTAFDRANQTQIAQGTLDTIDNQVDTTTGTVKFRALFDNPGNTLFPSQFVNVELEVDILHNANTVPPAAVQNGADGPFVFVVNPGSSTVTSTPVKLGPLDGQRQAILSGVQPNQQVVTDGTDRLKDGMKVTLPGNAPASAQSAGGKPAGGHGGHHHHSPSPSPSPSPSQSQ